MTNWVRLSGQSKPDALNMDHVVSVTMVAGKGANVYTDQGDTLIVKEQDAAIIGRWLERYASPPDAGEADSGEGLAEVERSLRDYTGL